MKVRVREQYAGPAGCISPGGTGVFSDAEGRALVSGGYGEEVPEAAVAAPSEPVLPAGAPGPAETTAMGPSENAGPRTGRSTRGRGRSPASTG